MTNHKNRINEGEKMVQFVSIIIPALNEEKIIIKCLNSIVDLKCRDKIKDIIVVDNGSKDNTVKICEDLGAKVIIKKNGNIASLRNLGANAAKGDIFAFLDADCVVPRDWLEKGLGYLEKDYSTILGFRLSIPDGSNWVAKCWEMLFTKRYSAGEVDWIPSGNMLMTRETFMKIGGFKEELESNEDIDFCFLARQKGCKIVSCDETSIIHLRPPNRLISIFKKELWHGREVFGVFLRDILENRRINIFKGKNFKIIAFSFFYLLCICFLLISVILAFSGKVIYTLPIALMCPLSASFILGVKYTFTLRRYHLTFGMTILLMTYGFSRALSLFCGSPFKRQIFTH